MAFTNVSEETALREKIVTENSPLESTGGKVWPASFQFEEFLHATISRDTMRQLSVLELGSGCGWLGMRLSQYYNNWDVTMSERRSFGALDWLDHNIALNPTVSVNSVELDWGDISDEVKSQPWDFVIGCELVYSYEGARMLALVMRELLTPARTICYYAHTLHRFPSIDDFFFAQLQNQGLTIEAASGSWTQAEIQADLFPEMELVVFKITS